MISKERTFFFTYLKLIGIEPRTSDLLGRHLTTEPHSVIAIFASQGQENSGQLNSLAPHPLCTLHLKDVVTDRLMASQHGLLLYNRLAVLQRLQGEEPSHREHRGRKGLPRV